jgi:ribulose-phosphate 3-epimerase
MIPATPDILLSMNFKLVPSILAADFTRLGEQLADAQAANADYIHVDVMDGHFVPNLSFGALIIEACKRATTVPLDVHLMSTTPEAYIEDFAKAGASGVTIHAEATPHVHRVLQMIKQQGLRAGLAVNPLTDLNIIKDAIRYLDLDLALVMSVNPGFGGQVFLGSTLSRIATVRAWCNELSSSCDIEVDGGINEHTIATAAKAGANLLVAGSAIFNQQASVAQNMQTLRSRLQTL